MLDYFDGLGNVGFSDAKERKSAAMLKQITKMVNFALTKKAVATYQIANSMTNQGVIVSRYTVAQRLKKSGIL